MTLRAVRVLALSAPCRLAFRTVDSAGSRDVSAARGQRRLCGRPHRIDIVDTHEHIPLMSKAHVKSPGKPRSAGTAVTVRKGVTDPKGSINLRIEAHTRQLIDDAAAILGKTRTDFMVESARRQAIDVLLDRRLFTLDADRYEVFLHALDNPPPPGPKLTTLMRRVPAWRK